MSKLTEQQKVRKLYDIMGERGLYVSTNHDVFTHPPEEVALGKGAGYKMPLLTKGDAYASPLLFAALTCLNNHGTMLITGAPGIGKTTGAEFTGHFFTGTKLDDILASEIQGHPQQTEEKMVASYDLGELVTTGKRIVIPNKFLQCPVKIIDEANRAPPDVLNIIMRLVDTGKAVYGGQLLEAAKGPLFVTANYSDEGTFQFTPPFLDRFDVAVMVTSPQQWDLAKIRARGDEKLNGGLGALLDVPEDLKIDFERARKEIKEMPEATEGDVSLVSSFADFVYGSLRFSEAASKNIARATKGNAWQVNQDNAPPGHFNNSSFAYTTNELSIRTVKAMQRYARAYAWFNGKEKVEVSDLKTVLPYLLWHKLQPTSKAITENQIYANDRIAFVQGLVGNIEKEHNEMLKTTAIKIYAQTLQAIESGKVGNTRLNDTQLRQAVKNAITTIGETDKPYAITLASHIAFEYNARLMRK